MLSACPCLGPCCVAVHQAELATTPLDCVHPWQLQLGVPGWQPLYRGSSRSSGSGQCPVGLHACVQGYCNSCWLGVVWCADLQACRQHFGSGLCCCAWGMVVLMRVSLGCQGAGGSYIAQLRQVSVGASCWLHDSSWRRPDACQACTCKCVLCAGCLVEQAGLQ